MDPNPSEKSASELSLDSEDMNADMVLFGDKQVNIPVPNAKVFNNLAEYYSKTFPKKGDKKPEQDLSAHRNTPGSSRFANFKFKQSENTNEHKKPRKNITNVIEKMQQLNGPLSVLYGSISKQIRILVRRRKMCALREERFSWITGQLIAFDQHLNLAMADVSEEYRHKSASCQAEKGLLIRKCTKQLLVRGDNVVLVVKPSTKQISTSLSISGPLQ